MTTIERLTPLGGSRIDWGLLPKSSMYRDLVFRPDVDTTIAQPVGAPEFLDLFMRDNNLVAGYVPFKGVAPADVDPGGSESPAAEAALAEYLRGRRESGDIERARQRLTQQGFPFGGI